MYYDQCAKPLCMLESKPTIRWVKIRTGEIWIPFQTKTLKNEAMDSSI
jgi:hypothetical protein